MNPVTPSTGLLWVKRGFILFRQQPAEMLTLFFTYMFIVMGLGLIPIAGEFLPLMLIPVFSMSFMQACDQIENGVKVYPNLLMLGFRSEALGRLLTLGIFYVLAVALAIFVSSLVDGGALFDFLSSQKPIDPKEAPDERIFLGMLVAVLTYLLPLMAFWFAAPLIMWKKMSVGKALFYSFFSVKRAGKAFLLYGAAWMLIAGILPALVSVMIAVIFGDPIVVMLTMLPMSALLTTILYCSFYPTYLDIFGKPEISIQA
ncbi:BPSS1780 family membrane protein [Undibacterium sp. Dicai25W]|uniref:BPSS1780 family membrane protein n=1 Tax=Undibacterium sp. Dicai25W TaxID=3413034 RepID=UPI003BF2A35A